MSYITEIQESVMVVIIWLCDLQFTTTYVIYYSSCISVIHDICSCRSHHHMIMTTTAPCISAVYDHIVVWFTTTYVIYYWNTRGRRGRDHMVMWFLSHNIPKRNKLAEKISQKNPEYMTKNRNFFNCPLLL
jgi:hypothetical protein